MSFDHRNRTPRTRVRRAKRKISRGTSGIARLLVAGLTVVGLAAGQVAILSGGTAYAVSTNAPSVTFGTPSISDFTATISYTVNRAPFQTAGMVCSLTSTDGPASAASCGTESASADKSTTYSVSLSDLNVGSYEYGVTVTLTDGGVTSNSTSLTIIPVQATCEVTGYDVTYDGNSHTATGSCTGVDGVDLSADLVLSGTSHTTAGSYTDLWSFSDPSGNYINPGGTVADSILVGLPPVANIVVDPGQDAEETVVLPPKAGSCPPQDPSGGGCPLEYVQDGSTTVVFDAKGSDPNGVDTKDLEYVWQILFPPTLQSARYTSNGLVGSFGCRTPLPVSSPPPSCGFESPVLTILPNSLPALQGTDAGSDIYWRAQLTIIDPHTDLYTTVYFRFKYTNTQLTLQMSQNCQEIGYINGTTCTLVASNGLPLPGA